MNSILNWFLMILPFALWGTSMAAMTPLVSSAGAEFVASLRLLPAGCLLYTSPSPRDYAASRMPSSA